MVDTHQHGLESKGPRVKGQVRDTHKSCSMWPERGQGSSAGHPPIQVQWWGSMVDTHQSGHGFNGGHPSIRPSIKCGTPINPDRCGLNGSSAGHPWSSAGHPSIPVRCGPNAALLAVSDGRGKKPPAPLSQRGWWWRERREENRREGPRGESCCGRSLSGSLKFAVVRLASPSTTTLPGVCLLSQSKSAKKPAEFGFTRQKRR